MLHDDSAGKKRPDRQGVPPTIITDGSSNVTYVDLPDFQRDLLFVVHALERREIMPTDNAILDALDQEYSRDVRPGRLYPGLHELRALGLLKEQTANDHDYHKLTADGRTLLRQHVEHAADILGLTVDDAESLSTSDRDCV